MSETISIGALIVILMILGYLCLGTCIERYKILFGHEASFTILIGKSHLLLLTIFHFIGMALSFTFYLMEYREVSNMLKFSDNTFFFVCLPPIVFASGFNMQRGNFFANIGNILLFGMVTTFFCFFIFSALTILLKNQDFMM
jgi:NhaP-type Na+/H+ or K+/H+ antiporter